MSLRTLGAATAAVLALAVPATANVSAVPAGTWLPSTLAPAVAWANDHAAFPSGTGYIAGLVTPVPGGGYHRALHTTTDNGLTWTVDPDGLPTGSIAFATETSWWALANVSLSHTTDAGATWNAVTLPLALAPGEHASQGHVDARDGAVAVTVSIGTATCREHDAILWSGDGGATWERHDLPAYTSGGGLLRTIDVSSDDNGVATFWNDVTGCGNAESTLDVIATTDGGATWTTVVASPATGPQVLDATIADDGTIAVGYNDGTVKVSTDGGATWTSQVLPDPIAEALPDNLSAPFRAVLDVEVVDGVGWAAVCGGSIWRTTDNGATWVLDGTHASFIDTRLAAFDADTAFTVAQGPVFTRR